MFQTLRTLFEQQISSFAEEPEARHSLELASAALLMEISRADHDVSDVEREAIDTAVKKVFHLSDDDIEDLMSTVENVVDSAISLFDFILSLTNASTESRKSIFWGCYGPLLTLTTN